MSRLLLPCARCTDPRLQIANRHYDAHLPQMMATVIMIIGAMTWGNVIATFCGVVATINPEQTEFRRVMDDLNRFMHQQGLEKAMRTRLREYFHQSRHLQAAATQRSLFTMMSPQLVGEVAWTVHKKWLRRVWFLKDAEQPFLVQVSLTLNAMVFAPGELIGFGYLYIVHRGIALHGGKVLTMGKVWGEDMILQSGHLQSKFVARAMNFLEVYMISREELVNVSRSFPLTYRRIRRLAIFLALRREIVYRAKLERGIGEDGVLHRVGSSAFSRMLNQVGVVSDSEQVTAGRILQAKRAALNSELITNDDFRNRRDSPCFSTFRGTQRQEFASCELVQERGDEGSPQTPSIRIFRSSSPTAVPCRSTAGPVARGRSSDQDMRTVSAPPATLEAVIAEQQVHRRSLEMLQEAVKSLRTEQSGALHTLTSEVARLTASLGIAGFVPPRLMDHVQPPDIT